MDDDETECPNCGTLHEIEEGVDGECDRCGNTYVWDEVYDEESDAYELMLIWSIKSGLNDSTSGVDRDDF